MLTFLQVITILKAKPPALSIADYIRLLRAHSSSTLWWQIESTGFWREQASAESARVRKLQARVRKLEEKEEVQAYCYLEECEAVRTDIEGQRSVPSGVKSKLIHAKELR